MNPLDYCGLCDPGFEDYNVSFEDNRSFKDLVSDSKEEYLQINKTVNDEVLDRKGVILWLVAKATKIIVSQFDIDNILSCTDDSEVIKILEHHGAAIRYVANKGFESALHIAAKFGAADVVAWLLGNGAAINTRDNEFKSPLHVATKHGHLNVVKQLAACGADMKLDDYQHGSVLNIAAAYGHIHIIKWLLQKKFQINYKTRNGKIALHTALYNNQFETVEWLVNNGADVNITNCDDVAAVHIAASSGKVEVLKWLYDRGARLFVRNDRKETPFHIAAQLGHFEILECLITKGATVNQITKNGNTALHLAVINSHLNIIKYLVHNDDTNLHTKNKSKRSMLHAAAENGSLGIFKLLKKHGCPCDDSIVDDAGNSLLHTSANHVEILDYLLRLGLNVDLKNDRGETVLMTAAKFNNFESVELLLYYQADMAELHEGAAKWIKIAAKENNWDILHTLLDVDINVDVLYDGKALLHLLYYSLEGVKILVEYGADVNVLDKNDETTLYKATKANAVDVIDYLLEHNADLNCENAKLNYPLHCAASEENWELVRKFVEHGANVNAIDSGSNLVLHYAVTNHKMLKYLVEQISDANVSIDFENFDGHTALFKAARIGKLDSVKYLVQNGADVNKIDDDNLSIIQRAAGFQHWDVVKYLILKGANVNFCNINCRSVLHLALSTYNNVDIVAWLLNHNANPNLLDRDGFTILHHCARAAFSKDLEVAKLLLESGADVTATDRDGNTVLHLAVKNAKFIKLFLQKGCEVNVYNNSGFTVLHLAARLNMLDSVKALVKSGADIDALDSDNTSVMYLAAEKKNWSIVRYLVCQGADVNLRDESGTSVLHVAVRCMNNGEIVGLVRLLVAKGANLNAQDFNGNTILHVIKNYGEIAIYLIEKGANVNLKNDEGNTVLHKIIMNHEIASKNFTSTVNLAPWLLNREISVVNQSESVLADSMTYHRYLKALLFIIENCENINESDNDGKNALHYAAGSGNLVALQYLLDHNANIHSYTKHGNNFLHIAVLKERCDSIKYILHLPNIDILNSTCENHDTALHLAARVSNVEVAKLLVEHGIQLDVKNNKKYTALHIAAKQGSDGMVKFLIACGADVNETCKSKYTALHLAAKYSHMSVMETLVENSIMTKTDLETKENISVSDEEKMEVSNNRTNTNAKTKPGETVLHVAVTFGKFRGETPQIVKYLVQNGVVAIDELDVQGNSALHAACKTDMPLDLIALLVDNGAEVTLKNKNGNTPLHFAARIGYADIIEFLLEKGADINARNNKGNTPVQISTSNGKYVAFQSLVKNGANLDLKNQKGLTIYHMAATSPSGYGMFQFLKTEKPDINFQVQLNEKSKKKQPPLTYALKCRNGSKKCVNFLRKLTNVHDQDVLGNTILHYACRYSDSFLVEYLLCKGADVHAENKEGETPYDISVKYVKKDIIKLLVSNGCHVRIAKSTS